MQNTKHTKIKKLTPGSVAFYDIRPENGEGLVLFRCFINLSLAYLYTYPLTNSLGPRGSGLRKSIRPIQKWSGKVLAWLSVCSMVQMICIWSSWCHCHHIISCFIKIQSGLIFLYQLTHTVLKKRPLCLCLSINSSTVTDIHEPWNYSLVQIS